MTSSRRMGEARTCGAIRHLARGASSMARITVCALSLAFFLAGTVSAVPLALPAPTIFAPGVISGVTNDGTPTFTPDGKTLCFSRYNGHWIVLLISHFTNGRWSMPEVAPFGSSLFDQQPAFAPDGRYLIYARSDMPGSSEFVRVDKTPSGWSEPRVLPETVNISRHISQPSIAANGDIYFNAVVITAGGTEKPKSRLYRAAMVNGMYRPAQPLSFSDGTHVDVDPAIAPDQSYVVFSSKDRKPFEDGKEHLFIAFQKAGVWGPAKPIRYEGDTWEGTGDGDARISPDGKTLYFTSDRSAPLKASRTHTEVIADYKRMVQWDNSNTNVWTLSLETVLRQGGIE
jgi:hypothetical protein